MIGCFECVWIKFSYIVSCPSMTTACKFSCQSLSQSSVLTVSLIGGEVLFVGNLMITTVSHPYLHVACACCVSCRRWATGDLTVTICAYHSYSQPSSCFVLEDWVCEAWSATIMGKGLASSVSHLELWNFISASSRDLSPSSAKRLLITTIGYWVGVRLRHSALSVELNFGQQQF